MPDNVEALKIAEVAVAHLVEVAHRQGVNYWEILRIFLKACLTLQMLADVEYCHNQKH